MILQNFEIYTAKFWSNTKLYAFTTWKNQQEYIFLNDDF